TSWQIRQPGWSPARPAPTTGCLRSAHGVAALVELADQAVQGELGVDAEVVGPFVSGHQQALAAGTDLRDQLLRARAGQAVGFGDRLVASDPERVRARGEVGADDQAVSASWMARATCASSR